MASGQAYWRARFEAYRDGIINGQANILSNNQLFIADFTLPLSRYRAVPSVPRVRVGGLPV